MLHFFFRGEKLTELFCGLSKFLGIISVQLFILITVPIKTKILALPNCTSYIRTPSTKITWPRNCFWPLNNIMQISTLIMISTILIKFVFEWERRKNDSLISIRSALYLLCCCSSTSSNKNMNRDIPTTL